MSSEIRGIAPTGQTAYAHLLNAAAQRWNGSAFETFASADYSNYTIAMTEQGSSGAFFADFPSLIVASGSFEYLVYLQQGGSSAQGDPVVGTGKVNWSGATVADIVAGAMTGPDFLTYVKKKFKRTDKDDDLYDAITDAIAELRRVYSFDEDETEMTTTAVISALGQYKIAVEDNLGLLQGEIVVLDNDDSFQLIKMSKQVFDQTYPNPAATNVSMDKPKHFCIYAGNIYLGPVPDKTSYTYRLNFSKRGATVNALTTSVPFTKHYREPLREGVLMKAFDGLDDDQFQKYAAKWTFFKDQIMVREERNQKGTGAIQYHGI